MVHEIPSQNGSTADSLDGSERLEPHSLQALRQGWVTGVSISMITARIVDYRSAKPLLAVLHPSEFLRCRARLAPAEDPRRFTAHNLV
jgi:hypothetical protein